MIPPWDGGAEGDPLRECAIYCRLCRSLRRGSILYDNDQRRTNNHASTRNSDAVLHGDND